MPADLIDNTILVNTAPSDMPKEGISIDVVGFKFAGRYAPNVVQAALPGDTGGGSARPNTGFLYPRGQG